MQDKSSSNSTTKADHIGNKFTEQGKTQIVSKTLQKTLDRIANEFLKHMEKRAKDKLIANLKDLAQDLNKAADKMQVNYFGSTLNDIFAASKLKNAESRIIKSIDQSSAKTNVKNVEKTSSTIANVAKNVARQADTDLKLHNAKQNKQDLAKTQIIAKSTANRAAALPRALEEINQQKATKSQDIYNEQARKSQRDRLWAYRMQEEHELISQLNKMNDKALHSEHAVLADKFVKLLASNLDRKDMIRSNNSINPVSSLTNTKKQEHIISR